MSPLLPLGRFFLPGPTEVHPEVLHALARPLVGHRSAEFPPLLESSQPVLQALFGTTRPVYVATSSATGMMEASVRNAVRRRALCLVNGAFSELYRDLMRGAGREVEEYSVPWGERHDPGEVERRLVEGRADAVAVVHSASSGGALNPLPEIAQAVRRAEAQTGREILLLVDGVTSIGAMRVEMDAWGVDFLFTGSQKAMALPPGLAFAAVSERLLERAVTLPDRGWNHDVLVMERFAHLHQTPSTPAVNLCYALALQCGRIAWEGLEARFLRHQQMARQVEVWVETVGAQQGLFLYAPRGYRSPAVSVVGLPEWIRGSELTFCLEERGFVVGCGFGRLREETFRIGHMGEHTPEGLALLLEALEAELATRTPGVAEQAA